jgi:hypothetical protein
MKNLEETVYIWPDAIAKPPTEGILAPILVCVISLALAYFVYALCRPLYESLIARNWGGMAQPGVGLVGILFVASRYKSMFPARKALVIRLTASADGLDIGGVVHHLFTNRDVPFTCVYPWSDVQQIELKSITTVEGVELGFHSVEIAIKGTEGFGGCVVLDYMGMKDRAKAKLKSAECLSALVALHPTLVNPAGPPPQGKLTN